MPRRKSGYYVHPKYRPMKKWWTEKLPIVGDLLESEEPAEYIYPRERTEIEEMGIFTPEVGILAAALVVGIYVFMSRR